MIPPPCFVRIRFGRKPSAAGGPIDFDAVYRDRIHPADQFAGPEPAGSPEVTFGDLGRGISGRCLRCLDPLCPGPRRPSRPMAVPAD